MAANLYAILAPAATAGESSAACIEGVGDVLRHPAGRDQHDVEADVALIVLGVVGEPQLRRGDDAALGALGHRFRRLVGAVARLDFDKDQGAAAATVQAAQRGAPLFVSWFCSSTSASARW